MLQITIVHLAKVYAWYVNELSPHNYNKKKKNTKKEIYLIVSWGVISPSVQVVHTTPYPYFPSVKQ